MVPLDFAEYLLLNRIIIRNFLTHAGIWADIGRESKFRQFA